MQSLCATPDISQHEFVLVQVVKRTLTKDVVAFGSKVTFKREDWRVQRFRMVGEDEADPASGSIPYVSPVAKLLTGAAVGDVVGALGRELEILAIG